MDLMDVTGLAKKKLKMDVTASSSSPTSSSSTSSSTARWKYDVFLSFRAEDTRNSFTDFIYAALIKEGINTFKDDENLEKGKLISELFKVIEQSRFAIVIFSKNYASSTWCLEELATIVQCEKDRGMTVLPVFYDVQPSDVRSVNGTFAHALIEHEKKNIEKVQQWRAALTHVSYISGWPVMNRPLSQVIQSIVERIISEKAIEKQWSLTYEEISSDLNKLELTMSTIQAVLQDAEEKQVKGQGLTVWLEQLKDVSYDAADVRDEFECEALRRQLGETHGSTNFASYSSFNLRDLSHKIKVIRAGFEEIAKVRAQFHLVERLDDKLIVQSEMTQSFVRDLDVIGRDEDKEKIIDLLMHPSEDEKYPNEKNAPETLPLDEKKAPETLPLDDKKAPETLPLDEKNAPETLPLDDKNAPETLPLDEKKAPETLPLDDKNAPVTLPLDDKNTVMKQTTVEQAAAQLRPSPREILPSDDESVKQLTVEQVVLLLTNLIEMTVEKAAAQLGPSPREILSSDDKPVKQTKVEQALLRLLEIISFVQGGLKTPKKAKEFPTPKIQKVRDLINFEEYYKSRLLSLGLIHHGKEKYQLGELKTPKKAKEFPTPKIQKVRDLMNFEEYYKPRLLSLGPIHHGKEKYQLGEQYKRSWAYDFIDRCGKTMDNFYKKIEEKIEELRDCYEEEVTENYDDKDLAWLLFVDGCAILRFIDCAINKGESKLGMINNSVDFVHRDLFLLENQLPYRLLKLLMSDNEKEWRDSIKTYIQMHVMVPEGNPKEQRILRDEEPIHLLDLLRTALLGNPHEDSVIIRNRERDQHQISSRNVQERKAAGIHLRRSSNSCLRDISFSQSLNLLGHLYIPPITLNNLTRPMFLNLVAYEKCDNFKNDFGVTSYIAFLRSLIKEAKDVRELRKAGIFYNLVDSDEEVAKLFNEMPLIPTNIGVEEKEMPLIPTNIGVEEKMEEYYGTMLSLMFRIYHDNLNSTSRGIFKLLVLVLGLSGIKYTTRRYPFIHAYFTTYVLLWHFLSTSAHLIQRVLSS